MSRKGYPVTIRGKTYPSQSAAARALGVPATAIGIALDRGTLNNVGLGRNFNKTHPVIINGVLYDSIVEACKDYKELKPNSLMSAISASMKKGIRTVTRKGITVTSMKGLGLKESHPCECPVRIRGVDYPSLKTAAESLNVSASTVSNALNRGRVDYVGIGSNTTRMRKIKIDGVEYPSVLAACRSVRDICNQEIFNKISQIKKSGVRGDITFKIKGHTLETNLS